MYDAFDADSVKRPAGRSENVKRPVSSVRTLRARASSLPPSVTMRWDPLRVKRGGAGDVARGLTASERQVAAKARFDGAVAAVGPGLADILWRVVCAGEALPDAERALAWPARSGKLVLRLALDRVAEFYRIG